jgi:endonuclease YncB( thermonuclease family)
MSIANALVTAGLLMLCEPALAQDKLCGPAAVEKDGDDLTINGHPIRLWGVDAFEAYQNCKRSNGETWSCGEAGLRKLQELTNGAQVCCERKQKSLTRGRVVMRCLVGEIDLAKVMVASGLAFDCPHHSLGYYQSDEASAKAAKAGAWAGTFRAPWLQKGKTYCCEPGFPREFCP